MDDQRTLTTRRTDIDGLTVTWDARVLEPRPWTAQQAAWLAELADDAPSGPILELCCGAGHIGLLAARATGRGLVQVDRDEAATGYALANAAAAGVETDVRCGDVAGALAPGEVFGLVLADPPWLRTDQLDRFPDDPTGAVDGGADGLDAIRAVVAAATAHTAPRGHLIVQVGTPDQADAVRAMLVKQGNGWQVDPADGVRDLRPGGVLVHVVRAPVGPVPRAEQPQQPQQPQRPQRSTPVPDGERGHETEAPDSGSGGSLSEGGALSDGGTIFPSDSTAGYPLADDEGGAGVQEGSTGPDAVPNDDDRGRTAHPRRPGGRGSRANDAGLGVNEGTTRPGE